ncbi:MAG: small multi-drug export protein, partial [Oscillospiraceae bacterium]
KPSDNKDSGNNSTGGGKNHAGGNKGDNTDKAPGNNGGDNSTTKGTAGGKGDNPGSKDNTGETGKPGSGDSYQFAAVKKSYFNGALFIGDSRTVGLADYSGWKNPTFYADVGLTIYDVFDKKIAEVGGKKVDKVAHSRGFLWALYVFVAIPAPGTGAWTGCLIATLMRIPTRTAFFPIAAGVATAGIIMGITSYGLFGLLGLV